MPRDKDLKRLVRSRMTKTGESYTTARAQILRKPKKEATPRASSQVPTGAGSARVAAKDYARIGGHADTRLKEKTGRTWEDWVGVLDRDGASGMTHRDIAELLMAKYGVGSWWAQTVTVGYERIKGLRERGQQRDGTYEVTRSRTFDVPVARLFRAWSDARTRRRWLGSVAVRIRTATEPKSMRLDSSEGGIIAVGFTAKGPAKSMVAVQQGKLPDRATADAVKRSWSERLDSLGEVLAAMRARAGVSRTGV